MENHEVATRQPPVPKAPNARAIEKMRSFAEDLANAQDERDMAISERDHFEAEYKRAVDICNGAKQYLTGLESELDELKRRCADYQKERDKAVIELAEAHTKIRSCVRILEGQAPQYSLPQSEQIREESLKAVEHAIDN